MVASIEENFPQREIADAAFEYQAALQRKEKIMVGVNEFQSTDAEQIPTLKINPEHERRQRESVARTRAARDESKVEATLAELRRQADDPEANLMYPILECARARVTVGEMVLSMQQVFGTYTETPVY
jgi:methylmalonyl-CoA mutase N-terminal domain/subunit